MKMILAATVLALAGAAPAAAETRVTTHSTTSVTKVHGPMHVLPHHNRKVCKARWVHHRKVQKCSYK